MRKLKFLVLSLGLVACQARETDPRKDIEQLEVEIRKHAEMDTAVAKELTSAYLGFVDSNPQDSMAAVYLNRAADILKEMEGRELKAIGTYNRVLEDYPESPLAARAIFMMGYVFDEKLNDKDRAARTYEHFLKSYPDHPLAEDAKNLLLIARDTLSDEELVKKWMENENNKDKNLN